MSTKYKSVTETADALGLTVGRVRQLLLADRLKGEKIGSQWAIHEDKIEEFRRLERPSGNPHLRKESVSS